MNDTPLYDQLVNERLGRGPSEFEGHDTWDDSEEARAAFERGAAHARTRQEEGAGADQADSEEPAAEPKSGVDEQAGVDDKPGADQKPGTDDKPGLAKPLTPA
ncbi:hypothetical protein SAMN05421678_103238 [Actinopolymorpha cephalotaxi]|uniref:Uncharacterized protein n=1 Tax=Actinopolymorpha cephalotaxi TaxID=504797 RepID=A0A1I2N6E2_9ACTN|nr:hypothetical protein [Actinopolymorpha cephalotaxi]NYH85655.1 hypothetical protein [Actinopolymorpha cephalotaxi]SFF99495.1 hypothetical protein SAMN05421678_103238 [Actinopolymorpha cephalotaxi]